MSNLIIPKAALPEWPGLQAAMDDVRAHGLATRREKMIVLNPDGTRRYVFLGDDHQVQISEGADLRGAFIVHDHPVLVELSLQDLGLATAHRTAGIIATMPDGSWSYAKGVTFRLPYPQELIAHNLFGRSEHPYFEAEALSHAVYEEYASPGNPEINPEGARHANRAMLQYLTAHHWVRDYRLHLQPEAAQTFTGLPGLTL